MGKTPVRMQQCLFTVLLLNVFYNFASSTFFHIGDTEKKCFIEEIPDETVLIGNFQTRLYDKQRYEYLPANQDPGIFVEAKDPDGKLVLSQQYSSKGRFSFTSHKPGTHQICLQSSSSAGGMLTVHLDIKVGERTENYTEIAAKDKLTELQLRVQQLTEQLQDIHREQDNQRLREKLFREVDHSTNMWIFWWPVVRSLYTVALIIWITNSW